MTITQLKYVLAVAEHQNFTKAAEKCFRHTTNVKHANSKIGRPVGCSNF